ncbi:hypothetical protein Tco_1495537, partial [Tanacetum coccineum]
AFDISETVSVDILAICPAAVSKFLIHLSGREDFLWLFQAISLPKCFAYRLEAACQLA